MEYTADELAEDSNNEKRLEKAEKSAKRKASKKKLHVPDHHSKRHTQKPILPQQQQMPLEALTQALPPRRPLLSPLQATTSQPDGPCFARGQVGHLRRFCPKLQSTSNIKSWCPPSVDTVDVCVTESCIDESSLGCMYLGQFMHTPYVDEDKTCTCSNGECVFNKINTETLEEFSELAIDSIVTLGMCVKRRLKEHALFWREELNASESVMNWDMCCY